MINDNDRLFAGSSNGDLDWSERLGNELLKKHPDGGVVKFLVARTQLLRGRTRVAIKYYEECLALKTPWKPIENISHWDLCWGHALLSEWDKAADYAMELRHECSFAPSINLHQWASFKWMKLKDMSEPEAVELLQQIERVMVEVPKVRIRYAGKTLPVEKFALDSATKYIDNGKRLLLPAYELFYVYNIFAMTAGKAELLNPILDSLEFELAKHNDNKGEL